MSFFEHFVKKRILEETLVKGIREPHEVKKKSFDLGGNRTHDLRIRSAVTLPTELQGRLGRVGDDLGGESRRRNWPVMKTTVSSNREILQIQRTDFCLSTRLVLM